VSRRIFVVCGAPGHKFFHPIILLNIHSLSIFPLDVMFCYFFDVACVVLFNVYGPRAEAEDKERVHFKFLFFKILQVNFFVLLGSKLY
jgi:hypothetical protein